MSNKSLSSLDIGGIIGALYSIYQDIRNWKHMAPSKKAELDYEDEIADENADEAFRKQKEFQEMYLTPEAQLKSQAAGFDAIGLNRMMLAGGAPGASSSSAPQASVSGASGNPSISNVLSTALAFSELKIKKELQGRELDQKDRELDIQSKLADAQTRNITASAVGQETFNLFAPQIYSSQVDVLKDSLRNNVVQRNLWRSNISLNEAKRSVERTSAFLNGIEANLRNVDYRYREQFNFLTNQLYYWGVESARVQGQYAERFAKKQVSLLSGQITKLAKEANLLDEKVFETQIGYMQGYQNFLINAPRANNAKFQYIFDNVTDGLKTTALVVGSAYGIGKLLAPAPAPTFAPTIQVPNASNSFGPKVPIDMTGRPLWTGE